MINTLASIKEKKTNTLIEIYKANEALGLVQKELALDKLIQEESRDLQFQTRYLRNHKYLTLGVLITFKEAKELKGYNKKALV